MTTTAVSEKISNFGFFELSKGISVQKAQESGLESLKNRNFEIFSETVVVVITFFRAELTSVWPSFSPGWIVVSLSHTLKKSHFLPLELFWVFLALPKGHFLQQGHF